MNFPKDLFLKLVYYLLFPLLLLSYLLEPFMVDIRIYLGVAKVTALTPGFPMNLDTVWESRYIGHRFLYYLLNLLDPFSGWMYSIWMKFLVAVVTIVILFYFSKRVSERMQISFHYPFILGYFSLFVINNFVIFSAEYFSVLLAMLMLTGLLQDRREIWFVSGLLIVPLLILKGLPVLLVFIVILSVILLTLDYKSRIYTLLASLPVTAVSILGLAGYFPHFISDVFLSGKIARIAILDLPRLVHLLTFFFGYLVIIWAAIPIIPIGLLSMVMIWFVLPKPLPYKNRRDLALLSVMWVVSAVYVLIIGEYLYYHYYLMMLPAVISACYFISVYPISYRDTALGVMIVLILAMFVVIVSGWSLGLNFKQYTYWSERDTVVDQILTDFPDIIDQPVTLYLDPGNAAYYFPAPSACRYVSPGPYQRDTPDWNMTSLPEYWENRNCALDYTGKYIFVDPLWFNLTVSTHAELTRKLESGYTKVYSDPWADIYQRKVEGVL